MLVAEVDDATARPDLDDAVVRLAGPVALDDVIAAYVDNAAAEPAVRTRSRPSMPPTWAMRTPSSSSATPRTTIWPGMRSQELPFLLELL